MFDMKNLNRLKKLDENAPDSMKAFWAFDKAVFAGGADGAAEATDRRRRRADHAMSLLHRAAQQGGP